MPIFEYRCRSCDAVFELLVRSGDLPACPACNGADLERLLTSFAVSSAEVSQRNLAQAREQYRNSKLRKDKLRHESEEIRAHIQDDYGIDIGRRRDPLAAPGAGAKSGS